MIPRKDYHEFKFKNFVGVNTDSVDTSEKELLRAYNMNLTQRGILKTRGGSETKNESNAITITSGVGVTSLIELRTRDIATGVKARRLLGTSKTNLFEIETTGDTLEASAITNISTGLTLDAIPDWEQFQNKMFIVNGTDLIWTDGDDAYEIGIEKPTVDPVENFQYNSGGTMEDGDYYFYYAYARSTSYGFYGEVGDSVKITMNQAGSAQKVTVDCTASNNSDTSSNKIYLFRTKLGDAASWYKVGEADNPNDGSTVTIEAVDGDNSILDTAIYLSDNTPPVAGVKFIKKGLSRMIYADDNYVYYSKPNLPECVPSDNIIKLAEDDGQNISGLGIVLNYLIIFKESKTAIIDLSSLGDVDPLVISNNIGCIASNTIQSVMNGQLTLWLSQEGLMVTDGVEVKSVVKDKIYYDLRNMDFSNASNSFAIYYKANRQYICHIPYANGSYKTWIFSVDTGGFTEHAYTYEPSCYGIFTNENDVERLVQGKPSTTNGYIVECDMWEGDDDGVDIDWIMLTPYTSLERPDLIKNHRIGLLKWKSSAPTTAICVLGIDGTDNIDNVPLTHGGSVGFDTTGDGFDTTGIGFDTSGEEIDEWYFRYGKGSSFNIGLNGSGTARIELEYLGVSFYVDTKRGISG